TTARSAQTFGTKTRSVHRHRGRFTGITWPYYCGSSPCVRIVVAEPPPVYRASVLWWPGFYDYADGNFGRGRPRYGGYPRRSGYHGDQRQAAVGWIARACAVVPGASIYLAHDRVPTRAAYRTRGQSRNKPPALSCATSENAA